MGLSSVCSNGYAKSNGVCFFFSLDKNPYIFYANLEVRRVLTNCDLGIYVYGTTS